jgi:hypothetical protein
MQIRKDDLRDETLLASEEEKGSQEPKNEVAS